MEFSVGSKAAVWEVKDPLLASSGEYLDEDSTSDRYPYSGNNSSHNTTLINSMPNQQPQYGGGQGQGQYQPFPTSRQGGGNVPSPGNAQYYGPKGGNGNGAGRGYPPGM